MPKVGSMTLHRVFDASIPPSKPYPGCVGAAGYLGGSTPHVWSVKEWNNATANGELRSLGIWVGVFEDDPGAHAIEAAKRAVALNWEPHEVFHKRYICLDMEDAFEIDWCLEFANILIHEGFETLLYRSLDAVEHGPIYIGEVDNWLPEWGEKTNLNEINDLVMVQVRNDVPFDGTTVDISYVTDEGLQRFGQGPRG